MVKHTPRDTEHHNCAPRKTQKKEKSFIEIRINTPSPTSKRRTSAKMDSTLCTTQRRISTHNTWYRSSYLLLSCWHNKTETTPLRHSTPTGKVRIHHRPHKVNQHKSASEFIHRWRETAFLHCSESSAICGSGLLLQPLSISLSLLFNWLRLHWCRHPRLLHDQLTHIG